MCKYTNFTFTWFSNWVIYTWYKLGKFTYIFTATGFEPRTLSLQSRTSNHYTTSTFTHIFNWVIFTDILGKFTYIFTAYYKAVALTTIPQLHLHTFSIEWYLHTFWVNLPLFLQRITRQAFSPLYHIFNYIDFQLTYIYIIHFG